MKRDPVVWYYRKDQDGNILSSGRCPRSMLQLQKRDSELPSGMTVTVVEVDRRVNDVEEKEVNGRLCRRSPAEIAARRPPKPDMRPEKQTRNITFEMWDELQQRIADLEDQLGP